MGMADPVPIAVEPPERPGPPWGLVAVLAVGLVLRVALLFPAAGYEPQIEDEQHYRQIATTVVRHGEYGFEPGQPTSIRPPLYPFLVAAVWKVTGTESLQAVRVVQIVLSLANVVLVYLLGLRLFNRRVALLAAAGLCFYPSLVFYDYLLLTEVLFTFLLTLTALGYVHLLDRERAWIAFATGGALGLAALTRSVMWPFPTLLAPLAFASVGGPFLKRLRVAALLLVGFALVVGPWVARNTRLQGVFTVVDTMGGLNLHMGNYEHTLHERTWATIGLTGDKHWAVPLRQEHPDASTWSEGRKEKWAQKRALGFMIAHPGLTLRRSAIKFADFWGLEREIIAGFAKGLYDAPRWFVGLATVAIAVSFPLVLGLAIVGIFRAAPLDRRAHAFLLLVVLFMCGLHTLAFGHSRYHLPLVPILLVYAAACVAARGRLLPEPAEGRLRAALAPALTAAVMLAIWVREVLVTDLHRIQELFRGLG